MGVYEQLSSHRRFYASFVDGRDYPRIQILTIRELPEEHKKPMLPLHPLPLPAGRAYPGEKAAKQQEMFG